MSRQPNHSILIFMHQVTDELIKQLFYDFIYRGIKVYLFTTSSLSSYEQKMEWQKAKEKHLFWWGVVPDHPILGQASIYFPDGEISRWNQYEYLCENTDFNREQYEAEHAPLRQHLLIEASAGTGKTMILRERFLFLLHMGEEELVANTVYLTHNDEAASHFRRQLIQRLLDYYALTKDLKYLEWADECQSLQTLTLPAFLQMILDKVDKANYLPQNITFHNFSHRKKELIAEAIHQYAVDSPEAYESLRDVPFHQLVNMLFRILIRLEEQPFSHRDWDELDWGEDPFGFSRLVIFVFRFVIDRLTREKYQRGEWEKHDLINYCRDQLPEKELNYSNLFRYLLIDEFQEWDAGLVDLLLYLQEKIGFQMMVVGDPNQSLGRVDCVGNQLFEQLKTGLARNNELVISLQFIRNYRNEYPLIEEVNFLWEKWRKYLPNSPSFQSYYYLPSQETSSEGRRIVPIPFSSDKRKEKDGHSMLQMTLEYVQGKDAVILVKSLEQLSAIMQRCEEVGFFCEGRFQRNFYRTYPVRELYLLLRYLLFPERPSLILALHRSSYGSNTLSNKEIINSFSTDGREAISLLKNEADYAYWTTIRSQSERVPILQLLKRIVRERRPHEVYATRFITEMRTKYPNQNEEVLLKEAWARKMEYQMGVEYLFHLLQSHFANSIATLYNVEKYIRTQMEYNYEEKIGSLSKEYTGHRIRCLTIEEAKGTEFDYVILPETMTPIVDDNKTEVLIHPGESAWQIGYRFPDAVTLSNSLFEKLWREEYLQKIGREVSLLYLALTRARKQVFVQRIEGHKVNNSPNSWMDLLWIGG
jgi:DNA helicase-2/ATP-dependent DNA helicase PcrA